MSANMFQMLVAGPVTSGQSIGPHATSTAPISQCGEYNKRYGKLHEGLETSVSLEGKSRVERILNEVQLLSDVEKLLLYLKLPTGVPKDEYLRSTPPSCLPASNRREQGEAMTWIRSHLEEHGDVCMPKAEVYEEYKQYCVQHELRPLCNADFGKVMKTVFPDINTRRLGQRGQSKYFYGGLRKKLDHVPPGLPELEIHTKGNDTDIENADTEVFRASCLLVCEWADKLLDCRFVGIQSIAEHLVTSMYVNTKSIAAFTLIAAMQETGNHNLKGSALFNTQTHSAIDKHKETNLLLQQKLHKNKVLQKQKEKLQAMKEENTQKHMSSINTSPDQRAGSSLSKNSTTPSKISKTPKLPSPRSSPGVTQSLQKDIAKIKTVSGEQITSESNFHTTQCNLDLLNISQSINILSANKQNYQVSSLPGGKDCDLGLNNDGQNASKRNDIDSEDVTMGEITERTDVNPGVGIGNEVSVCLLENKSAIMSNLCESSVKASRETPYTEMESDTCTLSHVRKISFDDITEKSLQQVNEKKKKDEENLIKSGDSCKSATKVDVLSKSAGHLSLKMLLERKDGSNMSNLNKSAGLLEKSKTNLLVSQSNVPGRSAFVPFAQVQQPRRDPSDLNQLNQTSVSSIPLSIPPSSEKSGVPSKEIGADKHPIVSATGCFSVPNSSEVWMSSSAGVKLDQSIPGQRPSLDGVLKILPGSSAFQLTASSDGRGLVAQPSLELSKTTKTTNFAGKELKDSLTILTASTSLAAPSSTETIVSASQHSPGISKHLRTRFTPIRPKGSPNKATKDKVEAPVYDKRPVSEILKEKRAKEQAEAVAKLQAGINLPTIPFQPNISLGNGNFGSIQQLQSVNGKEVVIIVNNQGGSNFPNLVNQHLLAKPVFQTNSDPVQSIGTKLNQQENHTNSNQVQYLGIKQNVNAGLSVEGHAVDLVTDDSDKDRVEVVSLIDDDIQPASASSEMDVEVEEQNISAHSPLTNTTDETAQSLDQEKRDKFEQIYTETPAKIARLNITSPFRPESACSIGRETPFRVTKHQEPCLSRPESACSFGRETPSGARKRKSSDYQQRKDFKRLNSTGDEGEEGMNERGLAELLSPSTDSHHDLHRRTQSCTFELDKDIRRNVTYQSKSQAVILPEGLQSPDILSLEEEALIESYPNSLYAMRPNKSQRHSIGVSARSVKVSQQRLLKQKQILDKQVGSFLQQNQDNSYSTTVGATVKDGGKTQSEFKVPQHQTEMAKDVGGAPVPSQGSMAGQKQPQTGKQGIRFESEPSGLPSDVADWINETIEKRQILNQSVLSEPELGVLNPQRASTAIDFAVPNFNFEVDQNVRARSSLSSVQAEKNSLRNSASSKSSDDNTFTVPKPPLTLKVKDVSGKTEAQNPSQRCQSLPMFTSTTKSPVSPLAGSGNNKHPFYQRGVSMSPRQPFEGQTGQANLLSPVSGLTSPLRRIEVRDNHPISVSVHSSTVTASHCKQSQAESGPGLVNYVNMGKQNQSLNEDTRNQARSYLASIQHNLQKPKDTSSRDMETSKSREQGFIMPPAKLILGPKPHVATSLSSSPQASQDTTFNLSQFSDSGYQSSGPSPICNTVPASLGLQLDSHQNKFMSSVIKSPNSSGGFEVGQFSLITQSTFPQAEARMSTEPAKSSQTIINSSKHSAFIPIQSSNQNMQFITPTPIRPTVSLPNQILQLTPTLHNPSNQSQLTVEAFQNQSDVNNDVPMISPKGHDPPPYEAAVKSLRQSNQNSSNIDNSNTGILTGIYNKDTSPQRVMNTFHIENSNTGIHTGIYYKDTSTQKVPIASVDDTDRKERVSLLANMGAETDSINKDSFGPFASKLVQLSKQTKSSFRQNQSQTRGLSPANYSLTQIEEKGGLLLASSVRNTGPSQGNLQITSDVIHPTNQVVPRQQVNETSDFIGSSDLIGSSEKPLYVYRPVVEIVPDKSSLFVANKDAGIHQSILMNSDSGNFDQSGAKVLISPDSEQNLHSLNMNMEIDFLQSPNSQPFLQASSSSSSASSASQFMNNSQFSVNPSHLTASKISHPAYKNISDSTISSVLHTNSQPGAAVIPSNVPNQLTNQLTNMLPLNEHTIKDPGDQIQVKDINTLMKEDIARVSNNDQHMEYTDVNRVDMNMKEGITRVTNSDQLLDYPDTTRVTGEGLDVRTEMPVDLDLMLQDLKDLERDLLQGHDGLNLD